MGLYSLTMSKEGKAHSIMFICYLASPLKSSLNLSTSILPYSHFLFSPLSSYLARSFHGYPSRPFILLISAIRSRAITSDFITTLPYAFSL